MLFRRNLGTYKSQHFCQGGKIVELVFNLGTASPNTSPIIAMQNVRSSYHPDPRVLSTCIHDTDEKFSK